MSSERRLLLVKLSSLGDVVHALPLMEALRVGLGEEAFLGWAVQSKFADILVGNPHISKVYSLPGKGLMKVWQFGQTVLRPEHFDTALDTQGLFVSGAVTALSGAKRRIGLDANREGNRLFLTEPVVPSRDRRHVVDKLLGFCDALQIPRLAPRPQTYLAQAEAARATELLAEAKPETGPLVGFIVGASVANKAWPAERWAETARWLSDEGVRVVLFGGPSEASTAEEIVRLADGTVAANLTGKTNQIRELAACLAQCRVVVGGDSGPTHLAVAVGTLVVGLYGVTDPVKTGVNWGPSPAIVLDYAEQDAPPESRRARHPSIPDALARIPATAAANAVMSLLQE